MHKLIIAAVLLTNGLATQAVARTHPSHVGGVRTVLCEEWWPRCQINP